MICGYCELIHSTDESYPLRQATRDLSSDFPRCEWHWRFVCSVCGRSRHFNGMTWCEKTGKFICIYCGVDHRLAKGDFWVWKSFYAIGCCDCGERHPALDRLEFQGGHPWQLHSEILRKHIGLSAEQENKKHVYRFLPQGAVVSDEEVGEAWDRCADKWYSGYTEFGDVNRQYVIDPAILKILGQVKGKRILDAGCGNGYLCRLLSKKGVEMEGVDVSKRAIELAEALEREKPLGIKYHVGSICNLSMYNDHIFDAAVSNIVLCDVQELDKAVMEFYRVLKPQGKLVFSIMHPCFSSPPIHGWVRRPIDSDRKEDWLFWKVDRYFDRSLEEWRYFDLPPIYSFHRPLSDYVEALIKNGFTITDFKEPIPTNKNIEEHYREFGDEYERIPWFLVIGARK